MCSGLGRVGVGIGFGENLGRIRVQIGENKRVSEWTWGYKETTVRCYCWGSWGYVFERIRVGMGFNVRFVLGLEVWVEEIIRFRVGLGRDGLDETQGLGWENLRQG